jgi:uncharacterized protein with LGFP repeats
MTWRKQTGKVVWQWGRVLARYDRLGREASTLGMPVSDVWGKRAYKGATYVNGIIVWSRKSGAHQVVGDFQSVYAANGGPGGPLSLPMASAARSKMLPHNGSEQRFQAGTLYRNPAKGVFALWGGIDARYKKIGEATSKCGYPVASMVVTDQGATASFEHGTISQTTGGDVRVVCKH